MGEQGRRETGVADGADMGAAIAQARNRVRVGEHLRGRVEVSVEVVQEGQIEQSATLIAQKEVDVKVVERRGRPVGPGP